MRITLLTCLLFLAVESQAQTFYYVNNIGVSPTSPTTADAVTITLFGDLSASNSYIVSTGSNVAGGQVQLTVNAASQGIGIPVLVPHTESFSLGMLPAGTYTITISGAGVGDFAPTFEHQFIVSGGGGSACDSLALSPLTWHPFTDTALVLTASNSSSTLFDYPGFLLLDTQGDTLAQESVGYFGIGQGPQSHVLAVPPGANIPQGSFTGDLELWTGFYQALGCTWTQSLNLCPPPPCAPLWVTMSNYGGAIVAGTFTYTIIDDNGSTVDSGTLELDSLIQQDSASACLPPGDYTVNVVQPQPLGGQLVFGLSAAYLLGPQQPFVQGGAINALAFSYFPACFTGTNGFDEVLADQDFTVRLAYGAVSITTNDGEALGAISILDGQGRLLAMGSGSSNALMLDVSQASAGLLIVQRTAPDGRRSQARLMNIR